MGKDKVFVLNTMYWAGTGIRVKSLSDQWGFNGAVSSVLVSLHQQRGKNLTYPSDIQRAKWKLQQAEKHEGLDLGKRGAVGWIKEQNCSKGLAEPFWVRRKKKSHLQFHKVPHACDNIGERGVMQRSVRSVVFPFLSMGPKKKPALLGMNEQSAGSSTALHESWMLYFLGFFWNSS